PTEIRILNQPMWPESSVGQAAQPEGLPGEDPKDCHPNAQTYPRQRRPAARERQKSGHTESAKLCCGSHLAAELKLQGSRGDGNNALRQKNSRCCGNL